MLLVFNLIYSSYWEKTAVVNLKEGLNLKSTLRRFRLQICLPVSWLVVVSQERNIKEFRK